MRVRMHVRKYEHIHGYIGKGVSIRRVCSSVSEGFMCVHVGGRDPPGGTGNMWYCSSEIT